MEPLHLAENSIILQRAQRILCVGALVHNFACLALFSYNIIISNRNRSTLRIEWLSFFSLLTIVIFSCSILCILFPLGANSISCVYIVAFSTVAYSFSKLSLYNFFLERLHIINSKASIQNLNIKIWRIALIAWAVLISSFFLIFGGNSNYSQNSKMCLSKYPPFVLGIVCLGDVIISLTISTLLCRALLIVIYQNYEQAKNEYILLKLSKKVVLLSVIAVITTQFSLIITVILSFGPFWTSLDSVINVWCILLSFGHSDKLNKVYNGICGRCHACFGWKQCLLCFACNCCFPVPQVSNSVIQKKENEETQRSSITGVTTTTDGTMTIAQSNKAQSITKKEGSKTQNDSKSKSGSNSIKVCIQSTIKLSIAKDGSTNVKSVNIETNVETN